MDAYTGTGQLLRCGVFELDVRSRELRKGQTRVRLQEQPFEILRMMLERPGHVVTREELRRRLWPDGTFVDFEHSLNAAVKRLRAALGDDADNPRFVETLPRRGYRFIAGLEAASEPREGASKPDIGNIDALKQTLLSAKSVTYPDPARGGSDRFPLPSAEIQRRVDAYWEEVES